MLESLSLAFAPVPLRQYGISAYRGGTDWGQLEGGLVPSLPLHVQPPDPPSGAGTPGHTWGPAAAVEEPRGVLPTRQTPFCAASG